MARSHKYIKREWKNGRWQYTYKNDLVDNKTRTFTKDDTGHHTSNNPKYGKFISEDGQHTLRVNKSDKLSSTTKRMAIGIKDRNTGEIKKYSASKHNEGRWERGDTKVQKKVEDIKKEANDYKKALSSKDEKKALEKGSKTVGYVGKPDAKTAKQIKKNEQLIKDYTDAKTVKGKAKDLQDEINKHHPEAVKKAKKAKKNAKKKIKKGRDYIKSRYGY